MLPGHLGTADGEGVADCAIPHVVVVRTVSTPASRIGPAARQSPRTGIELIDIVPIITLQTIP